MNYLDKVIRNIIYMDSLSSGKSFLHNMHPLSKITVTVFFILCVASIDRYNISCTAFMGVYIIITAVLSEISILKTLKNIRGIAVILIVFGMLNMFFDRGVVEILGRYKIWAGIISSFTFMLKGVYSVAATYLLAASTGISGICDGLRYIHIPESFVIIIELLYRYIILILDEVSKSITAYSLRGKGSLKIKGRAIGSLPGGILIRCIDKAGVLYKSMQLRGYGKVEYSIKGIRAADVIYIAVFCILIFILSRGVIW